MISLRLLLAVYLLGGITFVPLIVLTLFYIKKWSKYGEDEINDVNDDRLLITGLDPNFRAGELEEPKGVDVRRKGWLMVTKKYYYHHCEIIDLMKRTGQEIDVPHRSELKKKHKFYAVLKHGNLFLYRDDSEKSNLVHAISLKDSFVTVWPRDTNNEVPDSSMFTKRTCISILRDGLVTFDTKLRLNSYKSARDNSSWSQFFLYFDKNIEKEDWYFDLINLSKRDPKDYKKPANMIDPNTCARTAHLNTHDTIYLIQAINSTENQLTTQWINALLGRLFLSLKGTDALKNFIHGRLHKKLTKLNKPGFLEDFVIEEVDVGNSAPMITNPKLLELSPTGLIRVSLDMQYKGNVSANIATKVTISLGSHFKQRQVSVHLSIKMKELTGPMFLMIKPPPSNRLWYTFQTAPIFDVQIEPVVSSSKFSYGMITKAIKSKLFEGIKESVVVPYWDDFAFYNTEHEIYRAGIWEKYTKEFKEPSVFHDEEKFSPQNFDMPKEPEDESEGSSSGGEQPMPQRLSGTSFFGNERIESFSGDSFSGTFDSIKLQDPTLKDRTLQTVGHIKKALSNKGKGDSDDALSIVESHRDSMSIFGEATSSRESSDSKKYLKNSWKKIGQWYKGTSSSSLFNEGDESNFNSHNHPPEMISNRRRALPKRPVPPPLNNNPTSPASVSSPSFSPTMNATEMFVNKSRSRSNISSETNDSIISPFLPTRTNVGFVKSRKPSDFFEEFYANHLDNPNDRSNSGSDRRSLSQGINNTPTSYATSYEYSDYDEEGPPISANNTINLEYTLSEES